MRSRTALQIRSIAPVSLLSSAPLNELYVASNKVRPATAEPPKPPRL
jgi:hypothetical protein